MRGEQLVQCTEGHRVATNACVIAMVSIAVALLMPQVAAVAHKATKKSITWHFSLRIGKHSGGNPLSH